MKQTSSMHNKYTKLLFGFLLSILLAMYADSVQAQTYPVQTNVYLMPPYGKHLNDYYTTSKEKLVVSLLNRDQLKPVLEVRLRMTITASNGLKLQSKEEVNYPTITLDANIPTRLTQDDLAPYFQYVNSQGYLDQGKLPDGMVEFTFQVIEKYTGKVLSAPATGRVWLSTQKPPILRLPSRNDAIGYRDPMNLKFQWEPQHKNLSQVEYEFELREIPDNGAAPQSAFMYSPIIHQQRQLYTYLIYDVMMPPLDPNKLYGWRVRAIAKDGVDELNLFDNNGYSEIYWFRTQDNCQPPTALSVDLQNRRFDLKWLPEIGNNEFVVQYRPKYGTSEQWQEVRTYDLNTSIYDMQRGTVYEYRVGAICTSGQAVFTNTGEVSIPSVDSTRLANCGVLPILDLENKERLPELRVGDRVELSDYPMTVTKVSGSNGSFTGEGWVPVNWLLETKWAVEFSNITVNTDYKMIAGSVRAKYDETEGNIANIDQITEGGSDNTRNGIIIPDIELNFVIPENPNFSYNEETEKLVVFDTAGNPQSVDGPKGNDGKVVFPITIKDKDGNLHKVDVSRDKDGNPIVDEDGNPAKDSNGNVILESSYLGNQNSPFEEGSFNKKNIATDIAVVTFEKGDGIYAFDEWLDVYASISKIADKYDHLAAQGLNKSKYDVSWKLLPVGTSDVVEATIKISKDFDKSKETKAFDPKEVIFATEEGLRFAAEFDGKNKYTINLSSVAAKDIQEIYVLYPENGSSESFYTLGKLNVISYDKQQRKVVLVQVNGNKADQTEVQNYLDKVYNPVGVSLQVVAVEDFSYSGDLTDMLKDESGLFDSYNDKMQKLQDAYKASNDLTKDANYLFILGNSGSSESGFNPRGKQFGYIFTDSKQEGAHTIAHELGHGCWKLTHTFDSTYGSKIDKKDKLNLMSYGGGAHLARWQWDVMDAPAWFTNPLDGDEKGMAISQGEGILVKGKAYYAMHGSFVIELTGITVLPICGYPNVNTLLAFKDTNGEVWITNVYGGLINQETTGYVNIKNRNQKYPQKVKSLEPGDTVMRINYNSEKSELSIDKVFFKTLASVSVNFDVFSYINYNGTTFESSVYAKAIVDDPCKDNSSAAPYLVEANLKALEKTLRPDQSVELEYWNNDLNKTQIFTIKDGKVSEVSKPSSLDDILDGKWDDASNTKVRYTINNKGIVQVSAIGFKDGLQFDKSKKLDNRELSEHVTAQTNKYLSDNGVKSFSQKPDKVEQSDTFADGGNIAIGGGNASFVKIISDGVDVTSHLLKTGEFEERTYLTSSAATEAIHAPGIVTGVVEVGAQKITDLTSIGVLAYDLVVDEKVRKEMSDQLGEIKTQIQDDYKTFVPIMGEVLLTVTSGNTTEDMKAIFDEKTDTGKRAHLAVRGTGNTIITVMAGTAFVKNLPEISKKLSDNIANIQKLRANVRKVITTDAGKEYLKKFFNEKVKVGDFQEWYKDMITTNYSRVINFEVHHIFPVDLLKNNRFVKLCDEFGFDIDKFNGIENAIPLPKKTTKYNTTGHASHKKYNDFVEEKINVIVNKDGWSDKRKFEAIMDFSDDLKNKLEKNVLLGDKNVNDIRDWF